MGQDQSTMKAASIKEQPVKKEVRVDIPTIISTDIDTNDQDSIHNAVDEGIIEVTKVEDEEVEDEIMKLRRIPKFTPFTKEHEKGFTIENLLGIRSTTRPSTSHTELKREAETTEPLIDIITDMQSYIGEHMQLINAEQKIILRRIKYVDNITYTASQTIISAFNLAKTTSDKVAEASVIREQTKQIKERTISILKSLSSIEEYLDPDDRNQLKTDDRWAVLNELRSKNQPQSSDYLSTDTSRPELTSRSCSSSKSPSTVEKVIVTGESSRKEMDHESLNEDYVTTADSRSDHSSVAISRLKGLSSRSIHTPNTISAPVPTRSISEQIQRRHSSDS